jgi:hypothetical protein
MIDEDDNEPDWDDALDDYQDEPPPLVEDADKPVNALPVAFSAAAVRLLAKAARIGFERAVVAEVALPSSNDPDWRGLMEHLASDDTGDYSMQWAGPEDERVASTTYACIACYDAGILVRTNERGQGLSRFCNCRKGEALKGARKAKADIATAVKDKRRSRMERFLQITRGDE